MSRRRACLCSTSAGVSYAAGVEQSDKGSWLFSWRSFMQHRSQCSKIGALTLRFGNMAAGHSRRQCEC